MTVVHGGGFYNVSRVGGGIRVDRHIPVPISELLQLMRTSPRACVNSALRLARRGELQADHFPALIHAAPSAAFAGELYDASKLYRGAEGGEQRRVEIAAASRDALVIRLSKLGVRNDAEAFLLDHSSASSAFPPPSLASWRAALQAAEREDDARSFLKLYGAMPAQLRVDDSRVHDMLVSLLVRRAEQQHADERRLRDLQQVMQHAHECKLALSVVLYERVIRLFVDGGMEDAALELFERLTAVAFSNDDEGGERRSSRGRRRRSSASTRAARAEQEGEHGGGSLQSDGNVGEQSDAAAHKLGCVITPAMFDAVVPAMRRQIGDDVLSSLASRLVYLFASRRLHMAGADVIGSLKRAGVRVGALAYRRLIRAARDARQPDAVRALLSAMREDGHTPEDDDIRQYLFALAVRGRVKEAERLFGRQLLASSIPNRESYHAMILAYVYSRRITLAKRLFEEMLAHGPDPRVQSFALMIRTFAHVADVADVRSSRHRQPPREPPYGGAPAPQQVELHRCEDIFDRAIAHIEDRHKTLMAAPHMVRSCCLALLESFAFHGQLSRAHAHVMDVLGWAHAPLWMAPLVKLYVDQQEPQRAEEVLREAARRKVQIDKFSLASVMIGYAQVCNVTDMFRVFEWSRTILREVPIEVLNSLIRGHAEDGSIGAAAEIYRSLGNQANVATFNAMLDVYSRARSPVRCEALIKTMEARGIYPTEYSYMYLIMAYFRTKMEDKADAVFERLKRHGPLPTKRVYNVMIDGWGSLGVVPRMEELYQEMLDTLSPLEIDAVTSTSLMCGYMRVGEVERALAVFRRMATHGPAPNIHTYGALMSWLFALGRADEAEAVYEKMMSSGCLLNAGILWRLSEARFVRKEYDRSLAALDEMDRLGLRPSMAIVRQMHRMHERLQKTGRQPVMARRLGTYVTNAMRVGYTPPRHSSFSWEEREQEDEYIEADDDTYKPLKRAT